MNMKDVRDTARARMKGFCRVCPVCNGKACAGEVPGMGGCGSGSSFINNIKALDAVRLRMRLIHNVATPDLSCNALGMSLSLPIMPAPIGGVSYNMVAGGPEETYGTTLAKGSVAAGTQACLGDGPLDSIFATSLTSLKENNGKGLVFIKPWGNKELCEKIDQVADTGATVVGSDIDAAGLITLQRFGRGVAPKNVETLAAVVAHAHKRGLKFVVKGIMTVEDAVSAAAAGADGIVVSNHGGRVLDHTPGTAEVLPEIAAALMGRAAILVDGGVRTGVDVLKMLALGADLVLIGRPFTWAVLGGGEEGVVLYINALRDELAQTLTLTGCASVAEAGPHLLHRSGCTC